MMRIVILAAGKGKRMGSESLPKVLQPLAGRPLLAYVLDAVRASGVDGKPVLIVGHMADAVKEAFGEEYAYAHQEALRGTGDAVRSAKSILEDESSHVLVLYGDQPFVSARTIRHIANMHLAHAAHMTMGTLSVPDFEDWRKPFADFGRVIRREGGSVDRIVEVKDADEDELAARELNPSFFCFRSDWLWPNLEALTTDNAQGEYYLTALVEKAVRDGAKLISVDVPPEEALGVNTLDQLVVAEEILKEKSSL